MRDGVRRISEVLDVAGIEEDNLVLKTLFKFEYEGENADGRLRGRFEAKPIRPSFMPRLEYFGLADAFLETLGAHRAENEP